MVVGGKYSFHIQPDTASWEYAMYIKPFDTYDGRVVQLLACNVEGLTIEGYILPERGGLEKGPDGIVSDVASQWIGMERFERQVKEIMAYHEEMHHSSGGGGSLTIDFDEGDVLGWSTSGEKNTAFLVGYSDVRYEPDIPAVRYSLKFEIDSGFSGVPPAAGDEGMKNVPDGVGWVRNKYNTPEVDSWDKVKSAIEAIVDDAGTHDASKPADFFSYLKNAYESNNSEGTDGTGKSGKSVNKTTSGSTDSSYQTTASTVAKDTADKVSSVLKGLGLVAGS